MVVSCIAQGIWNGPSILLAPAISAVAKAMDEKEIRIPRSTRDSDSVTIYHGDKDTVIPLSSSERFVESNSHVRLIVCSGEEHSMHDALQKRVIPEIHRLSQATS